MFDIGFSEVLVIAVVALIVVGPERLPRVARTLGHLLGRLQRYVAEVKADINREMELDELRKFQSTMQDAAREIEQGVSTQVQYVETEMRQAEQQAKQVHLGIPSDERCRRAARLAWRGHLPANLEHVERPLDAFHANLAQVLEREDVPSLPVGALPHQDPPGLGERLEARGDVHRLAGDDPLLRRVRDHLTGVDADAHGKGKRARG